MAAKLACFLELNRNVLDFAEEHSSARVVVAKILFPFRGEAELIAQILKCVTPRTSLVLLIISPARREC